MAAQVAGDLAGAQAFPAEGNHLGALFAIVRGVTALSQFKDLGGFGRIGRGASVAEFGHKNLSHRPPLKSTSIEECSTSITVVAE
jgi:hypothetical protein